MLSNTTMNQRVDLLHSHTNTRTQLVLASQFCNTMQLLTNSGTPCSVKFRCACLFCSPVLLTNLAYLKMRYKQKNVKRFGNCFLVKPNTYPSIVLQHVVVIKVPPTAAKCPTPAKQQRPTPAKQQQVHGFTALYSNMLLSSKYHQQQQNVQHQQNNNKYMALLLCFVDCLFCGLLKREERR